jgi:recombination protein RecR
MANELPSMAHLLKALSQVPYLASKNLYRVADYFLVMDQEKLERFCAIVLSAKTNLMLCPTCMCWKEREGVCLFCNCSRRNQAVICIVETWQDVMAIEKTAGYTGVYHVLGGAICPLEGVGPEDLHIQQLIERVMRGGVDELILATNQTPEGEATAAFIAGRLRAASVKVSCLARGLPVGSSLEHMDRLTVFKALSERKPF